MIAAAYAHARQVRQEAARRLIVRLVFVVFLLLLFEGALRKWLLPGWQRPLYFSSDPFVAIIYVCALLNGLILRSRMLVVLGLFAVPVSVLHLLLAVFGIGYPIAWALGLHHYFFYIPLAFIIACCFRFEDLAALIRLNLALALPISVLACLQYLSPPSALVNRALAADLDTATYVAHGIVRPYGTFAYTSGHVLYVAVSIAMLAAAWLMRRQMRLPLWLLLPASAAIMVMALTTGSRSTWFLLAHTGLCLGAVALSGRRRRHDLRALGFGMLMALGATLLYASVLAPAYRAMLVRQETAVRQEGSTIARALSIATHAFEIMDRAPIAGAGLGSGILGAVAARAGERHFALAEGEWDRIVLELGPVLGLLWIGLRIALVTWLLGRALVANHARGSPAGLLLFGVVGPHLLVGQITMSAEGAMFAWLFVGLLLAATNSWAEPAVEPSHRPAARSQPAAAPDEPAAGARGRHIARASA